MAEQETAAKKRGPIAFTAALVLFAIVNVALLYFSAFYKPPIEEAVLKADPNAGARTRTWSWWLARTWLEQKQAPDVVIFGSSQMGSAVAAGDAKFLYEVVDALTHRRVRIFEHELKQQVGKPVSVFTLASPGAMCSDAYMASQALFKRGMEPKLVVLGVSPRDFIDASMPFPAVTEPYKFYSKYINVGNLITCAYQDPMSWLQFGMESLPCRKLGSFIQEQATQSAGGNAPSSTNNNDALAAVLGGGDAMPGKWRVPAVIPQNLWKDNTKEYKTRFKNPQTPVYQAEKRFFTEFLADMKARGITVLVVGMPSLPMNRVLLPDNFWRDFRASLSSTCAITGAQWLDLSDNADFVKDDYLDTVHLNAEGGAKLFKKIAQFGANDPTIAASLKAAPEATQTAATSTPH